MKESLYELWEANGQNMTGIVSEGDKVFFNGVKFSDAELFSTGEYYTVLEVESMGFTVESDVYDQFIFPDGLSSFEKAE